MQFAERLRHIAPIIRVSARRDLGKAHEGENYLWRFSDADAVNEMVADVDGIIPLGGQSVEAPLFASQT